MKGKQYFNPFQSESSPKAPRMVLLSSIPWIKLGTNLPGHGPSSFDVLPVNNSDSDVKVAFLYFDTICHLPTLVANIKIQKKPLKT